MKRLGKVFLGVLCMMLLFAFSHASEIHWVRVTSNKKVTFKWDATTTYTGGTSINEKDVKQVKYEVYVYQAENKDKPLPENLKIEEHKYMDCYGIEETRCEIIFDNPGYYFLGVRAKLNNQGSDVSWSSSKTCTSNNPFGVKVEK